MWVDATSDGRGRGPDRHHPEQGNNTRAAHTAAPGSILGHAYSGAPCLYGAGAAAGGGQGAGRGVAEGDTEEGQRRVSLACSPAPARLPPPVAPVVGQLRTRVCRWMDQSQPSPYGTPSRGCGGGQGVGASEVGWGGSGGVAGAAESRRCVGGVAAAPESRSSRTTEAVLAIAQWEERRKRSVEDDFGESRVRVPAWGGVRCRVVLSLPTPVRGVK